jgi:hypothetical protein
VSALTVLEPAAVAAAPVAQRPCRRVVETRRDLPTRPVAMTEGYAAAVAGQPAASNPYALGLPSDHEPLAMLWDDGFRVGRRRCQSQ